MAVKARGVILICQNAQIHVCAAPLNPDSECWGRGVGMLVVTEQLLLREGGTGAKKRVAAS